MKKIFITGSSGFVGSHLVVNLTRDGHAVVAATQSLAKFPEQLMYALKDVCGCKVVEVDYASRLSLEQLLKACQPDVVIHCASQQPRSGYNFDDYYRGNVRPLENLCQAMKEAHVNKLVMFSSAVVYGVTNQKITEGSAVGPDGYYAISKYVADLLLEAFCRQNSLDVVCLRLPSIFGPGQIGGLAYTYYSYAKKNQNFEIYSQGQLLRNLIHVDDVTSAVQKAITWLDSASGHHLFLTGSSNALTMEQIGQLVINKLNSSAQIALVETRSPVATNWDFDLSKAIAMLGFQPRSLEESLSQYIDQMNKCEVI